MNENGDALAVSDGAAATLKPFVTALLPCAGGVDGFARNEKLVEAAPDDTGAAAAPCNASVTPPPNTDGLASAVRGAALATAGKLLLAPPNVLVLAEVVGLSDEVSCGFVAATAFAFAEPPNENGLAEVLASAGGVGKGFSKVGAFGDVDALEALTVSALVCPVPVAAAAAPALSAGFSPSELVPIPPSAAVEVPKPNPVPAVDAEGDG